ncbi:MAG: hypothetical protein NTZ17_09415 [Phycisphaerae bacterium]|nr:hypothetical protein [Phycisphaerae bacterium]
MGSPDAHVANIHDNTLTVEVPDDPKKIAGLNAYLVGAGVEVIGFAEQKTDLEALFMKVSGGTE